MFLERRTPYDPRAMRAKGTPLEFFQQPLEAPVANGSPELPAAGALRMKGRRRRTGFPNRNQAFSNRNKCSPKRNKAMSNWDKKCAAKEHSAVSGASYAGEGDDFEKSQLCLFPCSTCLAASTVDHHGRLLNQPLGHCTALGAEILVGGRASSHKRSLRDGNKAPSSRECVV